MNLRNVQGNSYVCDAILSIGVYVTDNKAILMDSGSDEQWAKAIINMLEAQKYTISAIINTHCHPDHVGGNYYLAQKYPHIKIYATESEKPFIENPLLAPRCFCGLADPFSGLLNKYIGPKKCTPVTNSISSYTDHTIIVDDQVFKIISLPGHTPGSIGVMTPDNVLYTGDALFGLETIQKHPILFYTHIHDSLASFDKLQTISANKTVLYHGGIIDSHHELLQEHVNNLLRIKSTVLEVILNKSAIHSVDTITQKIMQQFAIPNNIIAFTLTQTAIRAYLTALEREKQIVIIVKEGLLQCIPN